jgi:hypothetical protein
MGNAFTFPLQTVLFTSLVVGAYRAYGRKIIWPSDATVGNFAVFGDDIIVHRECYDLVVKLLHYCGFTVNSDKSFNSGPFRESCGTDYFSGYNVRGVYLQTLLDDQDCFSAYNRLARWSLSHGIYLDRSLDFLKKEVRVPLVVPFHEGDEAGFKVPLAEARHYLKWHAEYQAYRYRCAVRKTVSFKIPLVDPSDECCFDSKAKDKAQKALHKARQVVKGWRYCPSGLLLLMLQGNIRNGRQTLRIECRDTEYRWRVSSCWDSLYTPTPVKVPVGYRGLNPAVATPA